VNIEEYISSGIIESYVLGLASEPERAEFERYARQYPELAAARDRFELILEQLVKQGAQEPPVGTREKIWSDLGQHAAPVPKIVNMQSRNRRSPFLSWVAAASFFLFVISGFLVYYLYHSNRELKTANRDLTVQLDKVAQEDKIMHDPSMMVVNMVGLKGSPASANIYWDSTSANVYMVIKNMPQLPTDKQYQLWALLDNKQVDLGLFDAPRDNRLMLKMRNTQRADAFAITIENRGNTGGPTLPNLQAMGKAKL
jgi:anti-sigma-K factor RskA